MGVPTKPQIAFLREHLDAYTSAHIRGEHEDGFRPRHLRDRGGKTWTFVDRVADQGWIEIEHNPASTLRFPYVWAGTRITDAGRTALRDGKGERP